jgi:hypothetical protein
VIRKNPGMTADLVRRITPGLLGDDADVRVELGATDASNVVPATFKADMVTVIRDRATSAPLLLVIIEPQGREDKEKRFSWPAYLANLRAAHECDSALLIVVCWDAAEAEKCAKAIHLGHPGLVLLPVVVGPRSGPALDGVGPWGTILAGAIRAIDLGTDTGRRAVLDAIRHTESNTSDTRTLTTIILAVASDVDRRDLEALMATTEYRSDFFDKIEAEGEARGKAQGKAEGKAEAVLEILKVRGIDLTSVQRDTVMACTDISQLDQWLHRALVAASAGEVLGSSA